MSEVNDTNSSAAWTSVRVLCEAIFLPRDDRFEERPCAEEDFAAELPLINQKCASLVQKVKKLPQFSIEKLSVDERAAFVGLILVIGEHSCHRPWTSQFSRDSAKEILEIICRQCSCAKPKDLVCHSTILKKIWPILCPKLARDCWKSHPAAVQCFGWILLQIETPNLGEHLFRVFPATLVILDDWETENKVLGCRLMSHIIDNATRAELLRQQFDDVAFETLQRLIYERDAPLVFEVVKCIATLIGKVDHRYNQPFEMGRYDKALKVFLGQMELEQGLKLRHIYAESLPILLSSGSICLALWSQRILRILAEYITIEDESGGLTQLHSVKALLIFLQKTWPRAASYANQALSTLLRLLMDITQDSPTIKCEVCNKEQIILFAGKCLQVLNSAAPERCQELLKGIETLPAGDAFQDLLKANVM